jgi:hypothetical protein
MKIYSIVRIGDEFVVQAGDQERSENREQTKGRPACDPCGGIAGFGSDPANVRTSVDRALIVRDTWRCT